MCKKSWWVYAGLQMNLLCLLTLLSCGKGFKDDEEIQDEIGPGQYWAVLKPLNQKVGLYSGWVSLSVSDNQFWARIKVHGPNTKNMHAQYIHLNDACPDMEDDLNRDGYLDFREAHHIAGPILVPLDSNLNSQLKGLNDFPKMKMKNTFYYYSEACNSSRMLSDLKQEDTYDDMMSKLGRYEKLNFTKRVIIIYGTSEDRFLPASVSSFEVYPSQASIPIACGEIIEGQSEEINL